ncbi:hypothetical protein LJC74_08975 [Eubacteriales bacterium OttesenSCG-928-A19]|nr:hypothetical protein [Eubacteriales bacterium OttesenSCG-928-A19]
MQKQANPTFSRALALLIGLTMLLALPALGEENPDAAIEALFEANRQQYGEFVRWPLEVQAEYQATQEKYGRAYPDITYVLPGEDDVPPEEAIRIGTEAIQEAYGVSDEAMGALGAYLMLIQRGDDAEGPIYTVWFEPPELTGESPEQYQALVRARTGEVTHLWSYEEGGEG